MEDRIIALTPWVLALMFELLGIAALAVALRHVCWPDLLGIAFLTSALVRTLPTVLRRLHTAWHAPSLAAG